MEGGQYKASFIIYPPKTTSSIDSDEDFTILHKLTANEMSYRCFFLVDFSFNS